MKLGIHKNFIFDIFLSGFFYFQILGINWLSSTLSWVLNFALIILVFTILKTKLNVSISKMWLFLIFIIFWIMTDLLVLITDFLDFGFSDLAIGNFYIISLQIPILALVFYYFLCNDKSYSIFSFISLSLSILLFFSWLFGFVEEFKYQIIGNIALVSIILFTKESLLKNKFKFKWIIYLTLFLIILIIGSRQSFLGLLIIFLSNILSKLGKNFFKTSFLIASLFTLIYILIPSDFNVENSFPQFSTISRFIANAQLDSSSNSYRLDSAQILINNLSWFPNGYGYTTDSYFLEPHNLFLELIYLKGYFFGGILVLTLFLIIFQSLYSKDSLVVNYLIIALLIPASVSYSLHAARFFVVASLVFLIIKSVGINYKKIKI